MLKKFAVLFMLAGHPAFACSICETELELIPPHVGCFKARIGDFIQEAQTRDPYLVNFLTCNVVGPPPDGFEGMGSIQVIRPVGPQTRVKPADLPDGYAIFGFFSADQLSCIASQLDAIETRPTEITPFDLSGC